VHEDIGTCSKYSDSCIVNHLANQHQPTEHAAAALIWRDRNARGKRSKKERLCQLGLPRWHVWRPRYVPGASTVLVNWQTPTIWE